MAPLTTAQTALCRCLSSIIHGSSILLCEHVREMADEWQMRAVKFFQKVEGSFWISKNIHMSHVFQIYDTQQWFIIYAHRSNNLLYRHGDGKNVLNYSWVFKFCQKKLFLDAQHELWSWSQNWKCVDCKTWQLFATPRGDQCCHVTSCTPPLLCLMTS